MKKSDLLKNIAETGYNVGFGAKKHFATYDIVERVPGFISFISMAFGVYALAVEGLSTKFLSASFIVLGIVGLYTSLYNNEKQKYADAGVELTKIYNSLSRLYRSIKQSDRTDLKKEMEELQSLESQYYSKSISKQILLSDWYAHYKFFWQHQIEWLKEERQFSLLRDKLPLTFTLSLILMILMIIVWRFNLLEIICRCLPVQ